MQYCFLCPATQGSQQLLTVFFFTSKYDSCKNVLNAVYTASLLLLDTKANSLIHYIYIYVP